MKWFEEHVEVMTGSSDPARGSHYRDIVGLSDEVLDGQAMAQFVRSYFPSQKAFGEFLGVGESTVAGWMKGLSFPDYAKRATLAAYYLRKYSWQCEVAKREAALPKVVKDGDRFMIVKFEADESGVAIGEVLARDIPTERAALVFAGGLVAWRLLERAEDLIDHEIASMDPEDSDGIRELKDDIALQKLRTFAREKLVELKRAQEAAKTAPIDDLLVFDREVGVDELAEDVEAGDV